MASTFERMQTSSFQFITLHARTNYGRRVLFTIYAHLHLVPRSKNGWSYTSIPPVYLHGVLLS